MQHIFFIYQLNQSLNILWPGFPLFWRSNQQLWQYNHASFKINKHCMLSYSIKIVCTSGVILTGLAACRYPTLFVIHHLAPQWILQFTLLMVTAIDHVAYTDGEMVAFCCNWAHDAERSRNISKREQSIIFNIGLGYTVLFVSSVYPVACLLPLLDIDPVYTVTKLVVFIFSYSIEMYDSFVFKAFRILLFFYMGHVTFVGSRTFGLVTISEALHRLFLMKSLEKESKLSRSSIRFYQQSYIILSTVKPLDYKMTTILLVSIFSGFILFSNVIIIGIKKTAPMLIFIGLGMIVVLTVALYILFFVGCYFYKTSKKIIRNWERLAFKDGYARRLVLSLPIIAMPAGDAGIIDVEIKINYIEKLLRTLVDSIVTVQTVLQL